MRGLALGSCSGRGLYGGISTSRVAGPEECVVMMPAAAVYGILAANRTLVAGSMLAEVRWHSGGHILYVVTWRKRGETEQQAEPGR